MPHKKGHTWKDAFGGKLINKAKLWIKSDKNPVQGQLNKRANIAKTASGKQTAAGRIQKSLVKGGHSKSDLRRLTEKNQASQANRKKMNEMRKNNPEKYRKLKKKQRQEERVKSFKADSSTWD